MERKIMPTTWFIVLLIIIIAAQYIIPDKRIIPFPYNHLGWIFIITGVVFNLWTDNLFKKYNTTVKLFMNLFYIRKEEANLMEQFGDEFLKYKKNVRQWI